MAFAENMTSEGLEKVPFVQSPNPSALDEALLSIIKLRDGTISLSQVSPLLGVSPETLAQSIERLQRFHLIERRK
jgi:Mn-dependent DtxR family transcriptional regulator